MGKTQLKNWSFSKLTDILTSNKRQNTIDMTALGNPYTYSQRLFRNMLFTVSRMVNKENVELLSNDLRLALLKFGSETWDNLNCYSHIEYGGVVKEYVSWSPTVYGLKIKDTDVLLSDIASLIEEISLPEGVLHYHPKLTQSEWEACIRTITLVLRAFENTSENQLNRRYFKFAFSHQLFAISYTANDQTVELLSSQLMESYWLLWNDFQTLDNTNSFSKKREELVINDCIDYGKVERSEYRDRYGFRINNKNLLISSVMNTFESAPIPSEIERLYPFLNQKVTQIPDPDIYRWHLRIDQKDWNNLPDEDQLTRWNAVTRIITLVLLAFERDIRDVE